MIMDSPLLELLKSEGSKYGWGLILIRREELDHLIGKLLNRFTQIKVLDIGCYGCLLGNYLRSKYGVKVIYYGVDVLEFFDKCKDFSFRVMSGDSLLYPANFFHLVTFVESLEHIPNYVTALREAYRVLRPDGAVFIQSVRCDQPNALTDRTHYHVLHPVTLQRLMEFIGFRFVRFVDGENFAVWGYK